MEKRGLGRRDEGRERGRGICFSVSGGKRKEGLLLLEGESRCDLSCVVIPASLWLSQIEMLLRGSGCICKLFSPLYPGDTLSGEAN